MSSLFVATWSCTWSSTSGRFCSAWDSLLGTPTDCLKGASWIGICWMYGAPNSMMFYYCLSIRPSASCYLCIYFFLFILLWLDIYLVNSLIQNPEHGCHRSFCGWCRAWYLEGNMLREYTGVPLPTPAPPTSSSASSSLALEYLLQTTGKHVCWILWGIPRNWTQEGGCGSQVTVGGGSEAQVANH